MVQRVCKICGKEFTAENNKFRFCSPECKEEGIKLNIKNSDKRKAERLKAKKRTKTNMSLSEIEAEARKHGMRYGEYVGKMGL